MPALIIACCPPRAASLREKLVRHNALKMSRIYPRGTRFSSTNMASHDFCTALHLGCQMIALNFQTWDEAMQINHALFRLNRGCGYVLRPQRPRLPPDVLQPNADGAASHGSSLGTSSMSTSRIAGSSLLGRGARSIISTTASVTGGIASLLSNSNAPNTVANGSSSEELPPVPLYEGVGVRDVSTPEGLLLTVLVHGAQYLPKRDGELLVADRWDDGVHGGPWDCGPERECKYRFGEEAMGTGDVTSSTVEIAVIGGGVSQIEDPMTASPEDFAHGQSSVTISSEPALQNGMLPNWQGAHLSCISWNPGYAFLRIVVNKVATAGGYGHPLAYETIPLSCLRAGYRSVQLRSPTCGARIGNCKMLIEVHMSHVKR